MHTTWPFVYLKLAGSMLLLLSKSFPDKFDDIQIYLQKI